MPIGILFPHFFMARYRKKKKIRITKDAVCMVLKALFVPPVSLAVWFGIASFCVICYLTAFGFD